MSKKKVASDSPEEAVQAPAASAEAKPEVEKRNSAAEEVDFKQTVKNMKEFLAAQPKVKILVPLEPGETIKPGAIPVLPVTMNGYTVNVPKGTYIDVPKPIADIVMESLNIYQHNSAQGMRVNPDDPNQSSALNL